MVIGELLPDNFTLSEDENPEPQRPSMIPSHRACFGKPHVYYVYHGNEKKLASSPTVWERQRNKNVLFTYIRPVFISTFSERK